MIGAIIFAVIVFLVVATTAQILNGGGLTEEYETRSGRKRREFAPFSELEDKDWYRAIGIGVITGAIHYFVTRLSGGTLWLAPVFLAIMIAIYIYLMYWWRQDGSVPLWEMFMFALIAVLLFFTTVAAADATTALFKGSGFGKSLVMVLPEMLLVATLGFYVIDYFFYLHREVDVIYEDDDDETIDEKEIAGRRHYRWGVFFIVVTTAILLALLLGAFSANFNWPARSTEAKISGTAESAKVDAGKVELDAAIEHLTVVKVTPEELEELTLNKYRAIYQEMLDSSLTTQDKVRTESAGFSDALTFGFEATENDKRFEELEEEILRNPIYGVTVANALKDKKLGNETIGILNPWMQEMVELNEKNGVAYWCEYRYKDKDTIYVTDEYREYAATLCTWLERLVIQDVYAWQTSENWCLNNVTSNNERKGVPASYQYKKDALVLAYVTKSDEDLVLVGFNLHDKRPEFYVSREAPTPTPTPTPTPAPKPTPTPTPAPKPTPTQIKDPAADPVNNGNADKGGGDNKPADGPGEVQPTDPRTENPTGNQNDNNQGHSDPATVEPETPPVVPEHRNEEVVTHENKMDYEPDPITGRSSVSGIPPTTESGDGEFTPDD